MVVTKWDAAFYSQIMVVDIYIYSIKFVNSKLAQVPPLCQLYLSRVFSVDVLTFPFA